ncbi:MAG: cob(I)yrinic acid a,c-diamide adenosyltransferase [Fimbriimonadaceae bacterium]|nr:cob(I)yrinic acid a,c-diamide adenosyltransferase [Chitinophagales bacterium]
MKIYTKTGDGGNTSLIGGTKVPKHHIRVEAYGTVDELNVYIGLIADQDIDITTIKQVRVIQNQLFVIGSHLASDPVKSKMQLPDINEDDIIMLEKAIDDIDALVPPLKNFILPGGHTIVSYCHIARVVCRRAERVVSHLNELDEVEAIVIKYLNRLSDYLFMLCRKIALELDVEEILWVPNTTKKQA